MDFSTTRSTFGRQDVYQINEMTFNEPDEMSKIKDSMRLRIKHVVHNFISTKNQQELFMTTNIPQPT